MLTDKQKKTFQDLKNGNLTARRKADFYYRISNILKNGLEGLKELTVLLNELPPSYLEKIDLRVVGVYAMELTEKIVELLNPAEIYLNNEGYQEIARYFKIDLSSTLPMLAGPETETVIRYAALEEDIKFFNQIKAHTKKLDEIIKASTHDPKHYSPDDFSKLAKKYLKTRDRLKSELFSLTFKGSIDEAEVQKIKDLWISGVKDLRMISNQVKSVQIFLIPKLLAMLVENGEIQDDPRISSWVELIDTALNEKAPPSKLQE
jgi:hypothetical protein